jgi:superfamily II RNA helicase
MLSSYLYTINPDMPCENIQSDILTKFPYPLDPFQKYALSAIEKGENVLCCAKTGSGKSAIAEMLVYHTLAAGKRVFYTTPIKSLSNQKFHDLKGMFPSVGILTGDIKYKPDAQILIMTTEILRNLLYKQQASTKHLGLTAEMTMEGLGAVVFDEVHYINDRERGKVWEETMILLPPEIQLVLLSATIDQPELFAAWLGELKQRPICLISTTYRVVPLIHHVLLGDQAQVIMDAKDVYHGSTYSAWLTWRESKAKAQDAKSAAVAGRRAGGYHDPVIKGAGGLTAFPHQLNQMVSYLTKKDLMPCLFFVFSRAGCEKYAHQVEGSLIDSSDAAAVKHIWDFHLHRFKDRLEHLPQAHKLLDLLMRGIAFHHSGLLPLLREMVEILFAKGLIRALFATETFAVGINMPTRTVVFLDYMKFSDETNGLRLLRTDEYIQMAGRAGRRGKDTVGHVFYLPQREAAEESQVKGMMTGRRSAVESRMDFGYDFLLKVIQAGNLRWMDILEKSYWNQQRIRGLQRVRKEISDVEAHIHDHLAKKEELEACELRATYERKIKETTNAARRDAQKLLDSWKNRHVGPVWEKAWQQYKCYKGNLEELAELQSTERLLSQTHETLAPRLQFLKEREFLDSDKKLTLKGILATEVNEGHSLLMSEVFLQGWASDMEPAELVAFLATFLGEAKENDKGSVSPDSLRVPQKVIDLLWKLDRVAAYSLAAEEQILGSVAANPLFWSLQTTWIEPCYRWFQGESAAVLCAEYELFEGNFVRTILKLANVVEEWLTMAAYTQSVELLARYEGMRDRIVRDLVRPESLYLTL